jgi:opacity protein-like surface antigen
MSLVRFRLHMVLPLLTAVAPVARAAESDTPWKFELFGGDSVALHGSLRPPGEIPLPDLGLVSPAFAGDSGSLGLNRMRYDDIFGRKYDAGTELSYAFSDYVSAYGRFSYDALSGRTREVGVLTTPAGLAPLRANFDDLDTWSLELGSRYYFPTNLSFRPFAGAGLGMTRVHAISASFDIPSEAIAFPQVDLTRSDTRFTQNIETGIEMQSSPNLDFRLAVAADHMSGAHESHDPELNALGLNSGHAGEQWSFPVTIGAAYRF